MVTNSWSFIFYNKVIVHFIIIIKCAGITHRCQSVAQLISHFCEPFFKSSIFILLLKLKKTNAFHNESCGAYCLLKNFFNFIEILSNNSNCCTKFQFYNKPDYE